ncbi:MAG: nucleoside recognition protein [Lachnospiraceae bacterium]|nr:nucleoside recognition protein [Lachnospiraceae bacterium]MCI9546357.1 nucleoside recognition protein [Lachnospiraceae bacterium]
MNYLWAFMILIGIVYGSLTGNLQSTADAALSSAQEAVQLSLTMCGIMALWVGLMEIAKDSGLIEKIKQSIEPLLHFLFPNIPENHPAKDPIAVNIIANVLGLGWAATPAGLKAMEELGKLEEDRREGKLPGPVRKRGIASNEMCTFLIINISSLQLIPVNVIAYRSQYGSVNPAAIVGPGIVATAVSTVVAIVYCKMMDGKRRG